MDGLHSITRLGQTLLDVFTDHHGAVLAAGAPKCNGQIALSFANIVRNQIDEQIRDTVNEFLCLGK